VLVNANHERLARKRREEMLGRSLWEVFPDIATPESVYWREYHRVVEQREPAQFEAYYAPLDLWTSVSAYPTSEGGLAVFLRDETERKRAEQFRERLLGIVSHDLRNPLSNILMTTQLLLRREGVPETVRPGVQRIATSADRMQRMISDLLDFTRATVGGGIPLERRPTSLCALVETTLEEFELTHPGRVVSTCARGMTEGVWDPDRLVQVVSNLVSNALAHGDEGTPVRVRVWEDGTDHLFSVHNAGPPIPGELLPRIFDPFKRALGNGGRKGLGLGLYIVQQLVLAHGGTIEVRSTREEGTTFTVRLPRVPG
jgi:signal transduction histidine kinase